MDCWSEVPVSYELANSYPNGFFKASAGISSTRYASEWHQCKAETLPHQQRVVVISIVRHGKSKRENLLLKRWYSRFRVIVD